MLYIIGLGLGDEKDITIRGFESIQKCDKIYLEHYTSILGINIERLELFYGKKITIADRTKVESEVDEIFESSKGKKNAALLVVGDPLCATTHVDIILRAKQMSISYEVIHNTSVMGAVAICGLQLYQYGYTVSIPFYEENWKPSSFYKRIKYNLLGGMHTLCLLDIKVKEPDYDALSKGGKLKYLPPRFMTVNRAIEQLLDIELEDPDEKSIITGDTYAVGMARLGQRDQKIVYGTLNELKDVDFGLPLHCLAICGEIHPLELEILQTFKL